MRSPPGIGVFVSRGDKQAARKCFGDAGSNYGYSAADSELSESVSVFLWRDSPARTAVTVTLSATNCDRRWGSCSLVRSRQSSSSRRCSLKLRARGESKIDVVASRMIPDNSFVINQRHSCLNILKTGR